MRGGPRGGGRRGAVERRGTGYSLEAVLDAAVAILDEAGPAGLTFRALGARLGGGVSSIYWYVEGKDELLDRAVDRVVGQVLADVRALPQSDPIDDLRAGAVVLFDHIVRRPWLATYFMRNTDLQPNSLHLYEHLGQQLLRLDLTPRQRFHAVSAVTGFAVGTAADLGAEPPVEVADGSVGREEYLQRYADRWRAMDEAEFPFVRQIADEFAVHDDADQFRAGLDLLLAGLRLQAGA